MRMSVGMRMRAGCADAWSWWGCCCRRSLSRKFTAANGEEYRWIYHAVKDHEWSVSPAPACAVGTELTRCLLAWSIVRRLARLRRRALQPEAVRKARI